METILIRIKPFTFLLSALILLSTTVCAQSTPKEPKPYMARVLLNSGEKVKGILHSATDDSIFLEDPKTKVQTTVAPEQVAWIKVRRKGRLGRGALIGGVSGGLLAGLTVNWWDNEVDENLGIDVPDNETVLPAILVGAASGAAIGGLIASKSDKFYINGNREVYLSTLPGIQSYCLVKVKGN
ncbi:hypothetical protein [Lentiprolixibacter aurantiacus]|uniref:Glycine zipper 2TM domain-containing protein n=1 Tax=Lentiprolixibacter aurantiacus TaxID=2993939 RepID=A0AAE3MJH3_9FLAO|nr:hypothetical protein [Lentiprolixibacter aurantiacus]MCX2718446.1 hypothetical protein [Lentiprolixibacter aurantiacus]